MEVKNYEDDWVTRLKGGMDFGLMLLHSLRRDTEKANQVCLLHMSCINSNTLAPVAGLTIYELSK
jgi:hypothetical protein